MITDNQRKAINMIEENLNAKFHGETYKEAQDFIVRFMPYSEMISDYYKEKLLTDFGGYRETWKELWWHNLMVESGYEYKDYSKGNVYYVVMENHGHIICFKTKKYDEEVKELLEWGRKYYYVEMVFKNPDGTAFTDSFREESKEDFMEELFDNRLSYVWDDEEPVEENIKKIESILI